MAVWLSASRAVRAQEIVLKATLIFLVRCTRDIRLLLFVAGMFTSNVFWMRTSVDISMFFRSLRSCSRSCCCRRRHKPNFGEIASMFMSITTTFPAYSDVWNLNTLESISCLGFKLTTQCFGSLFYFRLRIDGSLPVWSVLWKEVVIVIEAINYFRNITFSESHLGN
jgi:hypothetical protein